MFFDIEIVVEPKRLSFQLTSSKVNNFAKGRHFIYLFIQDKK